MTWLDIGLIFLFLFFVVLGARLGSLWTASCIMGGFLGAALVDTYSLPLAGMMGNFQGSTVLAAILLFVGGVGVILIPGAVLSQIGSVFILHIFDGAFGLFTGAFAATFLIALLLLSASTFFPRFESSRAFKRSTLARPYYLTLQEIFDQTPFMSSRTHKKIQEEAEEKIVPLAKEASKKIKGMEKTFSDKIAH